MSLNWQVPIIYQRESPVQSALQGLAHTLLTARQQKASNKLAQERLDVEKQAEQRRQDKEDYKERQDQLRAIQDDLINGRPEQARLKMSLYSRPGGKKFSITGGDIMGGDAPQAGPAEAPQAPQTEAPAANPIGDSTAGLANYGKDVFGRLASSAKAAMQGRMPSADQAAASITPDTMGQVGSLAGAEDQQPTKAPESGPGMMSILSAAAKSAMGGESAPTGAEAMNVRPGIVRSAMYSAPPGPSTQKRSPYQVTTPTGESFALDTDAIRDERRRNAFDSAQRMDDYVGGNDALDPEARSTSRLLASAARAEMDPDGREALLKANMFGAKSAAQQSAAEENARLKREMAELQRQREMDVQGLRNQGNLEVAKLRKGKGGSGGKVANETGFKELTKMYPQIATDVKTVLNALDYKNLNKAHYRMRGLIADARSGEPARLKALMGEFATMAQSRDVGNRLTDKDIEFFSKQMGSLPEQWENSLSLYLTGGMAPQMAKKFEGAVTAWSEQMTERMNDLEASLTNNLDNSLYVNRLTPEEQAKVKQQWLGTVFGPGYRGAAPAPKASAPTGAAPASTPSAEPSDEEMASFKKKYGL